MGEVEGGDRDREEFEVGEEGMEIQVGRAFKDGGEEEMEVEDEDEDGEDGKGKGDVGVEKGNEMEDTKEPAVVEAKSADQDMEAAQPVNEEDKIT